MKNLELAEGDWPMIDGGHSAEQISTEVTKENSARPNRRVINEDVPSKQTLIIPRKTHNRLKGYCHEHGCSLQDIFTEMMNSWLVSHGEPEMYDSEGNEL